MDMNRSTAYVFTKIMNEDEGVARYAVEGDMFYGYCIVPLDKNIRQLDVAACIEDTLHRIIDFYDSIEDIDVWCDENDVDIADKDNFIFAAMRASQDVMEDEDSDSIIEIDLGYRIHGALHGALMSFERVPRTAYWFEKRIYRKYQLLWMMDHNISLEEAFTDWMNYLDPENGFSWGMSEASEAFDDWEASEGFSGELYACFGEFLDAEYREYDSRWDLNSSEKRMYERDNHMLDES